MSKNVNDFLLFLKCMPRKLPINHEKVEMHCTFITIFFNCRKWGVAENNRLNGYELPESFTQNCIIDSLTLPTPKF